MFTWARSAKRFANIAFAYVFREWWTRKLGFYCQSCGSPGKPDLRLTAENTGGAIGQGPARSVWQSRVHPAIIYLVRSSCCARILVSLCGELQHCVGHHNTWRGQILQSRYAFPPFRLHTLEFKLSWSEGEAGRLIDWRLAVSCSVTGPPFSQRTELGSVTLLCQALQHSACWKACAHSISKTKRNKLWEQGQDTSKTSSCGLWLQESWTTSCSCQRTAACSPAGVGMQFSRTEMLKWSKPICIYLFHTGVPTDATRTSRPRQASHLISSCIQMQGRSCWNVPGASGTNKMRIPSLRADLVDQ